MAATNYYRIRLLMYITVSASIVAAVFLFTSRQKSVDGQHFETLAWRLGFRRSRLSLSLESSQNHSVFKILQVADLHLGEAEDTFWGPLQDVLSFSVLDSVIPKEKPNLIILSGDQITANNINKNATSYYQALDRRLASYRIPWAMTFGNHDDAPFEVWLKNGTVVKYPAKTSRLSLLRADQKFPLSLSQVGPRNISGTSNYILHVKGRNGAQAAQIVLLDSGGGSIPVKMESNQITWLQQHLVKGVPAVAFEHIPADSNDFRFIKSRCKGFHEDGVAPLDKDPGIINALAKLGNVHFLAVGHNHGNDYCCRVQNSTAGQQKNQVLHVCFGRHTGYGGYGGWERGARVYQLQFSQQGKFSWKSWVRMEDGRVIDTYQPSF